MFSRGKFKIVTAERLEVKLLSICEIFSYSGREVLIRFRETCAVLLHRCRTGTRTPMIFGAESNEFKSTPEDPLMTELGSLGMETGLEKDRGKAQFQQELNRWFESRGIITDLRSHLRHLMVTALQSTQLGSKPTDGSSPKAQALNLIVAEHLLRHGCHYTLSVFTSEVPTLANFNPGSVLRGGRKPPEGVCFRDNQIEEIFNALGMSSREEELTLLKSRYLEKGNEASLLQLFLQAVINATTKLHIRQNLESLAAEGGERLLSKKWSTNIADILLAEKMTTPQITAVEDAVFRITEREVRRILEEERGAEMQKLATRERRIQESLRKHEEEILTRLTEAENELKTRKGIIEEELMERQRHLARMAVEWNDKHEEIVRLSKSFHNIENENRRLEKKVKELEEENGKLTAEGESQGRAADALREELDSLRFKLKEVTDRNAALSERIQVLIRREHLEVTARHDEASQFQEEVRANGEEIPLLWSRNTGLEDLAAGNRVRKEGIEDGTQTKEPPVKIQTISPAKQRDVSEPSKPQFQWSDAEPNRRDLNSNSSGDEDEVSPSSEDIVIEVRKRLQDLEAETDRINQNYLAYKLKCVSVDSCSESSSARSDKSPGSPPNLNERPVITETKFCQTVGEDTFAKMQKLEGRKEENEYERSLMKKLEEVTPRMPVMRVPSKRQLEHRDFFMKSRQLLHELERQDLEDLQATTPSVVESPTFSSGGEEFTRSFSKGNKKSPERSVLLTPLRTASFYYNDEPEVQKPTEGSPKIKSVDPPEKLTKNDMDCLALLEETRIKTPQLSARKPLRQQILLSESEKDPDDDKTPNLRKSATSSPVSPASGKLSAGKRSGSESFW